MLSQSLARVLGENASFYLRRRKAQVVHSELILFLVMLKSCTVSSLPCQENWETIFEGESVNSLRNDFMCRSLEILWVGLGRKHSSRAIYTQRHEKRLRLQR